MSGEFCDLLQVQFTAALRFLQPALNRVFVFPFSVQRFVQSFLLSAHALKLPKQQRRPISQVLILHAQRFGYLTLGRPNLRDLTPHPFDGELAALVQLLCQVILGDDLALDSLELDLQVSVLLLLLFKQFLQLGFRLLKRIDCGLVLLAAHRGFLLVALELYELSVQVDVGLLGLVIARNPLLAVVFLRGDLLLELVHFVGHLLPLNFKLFLLGLLLDLDCGEFSFGFAAARLFRLVLRFENLHQPLFFLERAHELAIVVP